MIAKLKIADLVAAFAGVLLFVSSLLHQIGSFNAYHGLVINVLIVTYLLGIVIAAASVAVSLGVLPGQFPWRAWAAAGSFAVVLNAIFGAVALSELLKSVAASQGAADPGLSAGVWLGLSAAVLLFVSVALRSVIPVLDRAIPSGGTAKEAQPDVPVAGGPYPDVQFGVPAQEGDGNAPTNVGSPSFGPPPGSSAPSPAASPAASAPSPFAPAPFAPAPAASSPFAPAPPEAESGGPGPAGSPFATPPAPAPDPAFAHQSATPDAPETQPAAPGATEAFPPPTASSDPASSDPASSDPASSDPASSAAPDMPNPVISNPVISNPGTSDPVTQTIAAAVPPPAPAPPATAPFTPFWAAVPTPRPIYSLDSPAVTVATLQPGTWYAAVAAHSHGITVQLPTGETGVLVEVADLFRG
jgi:hypothetical protein